MSKIIKAEKEQISAIVELLIEHIDYIYIKMFPGTTWEKRKELLSKVLLLFDINNFLEYNRFHCYLNKEDQVIGITGLITTEEVRFNHKISYILKILSMLNQSLSFIQFLCFLLSLYKNRALFTSDVADSGYITYIIVREGYQKNGIGTQLLNFSINHFKQKGYKSVSLVVRSSNINALNFFRKNNFKEIKRKKDQFITYGQKVTMEKQI